MIALARRDLEHILQKIDSPYLKEAFYKLIRKRQIT
jgi:hypothetical protein